MDFEFWIPIVETSYHGVSNAPSDGKGANKG